MWKEETAGELIDKSAMYGIQIISDDIIKFSGMIVRLDRQITIESS